MGSATYVDFVLLVLRVSLGVTMFFHGYNKVRNGIAGTAGWFNAIGMRPGKLNAQLAAGTEMASGVLFVLGLLTPLAAAMMIGLMAVAFWVAHRDKGFFIFNPDQGWEYVFIIGIAAFAVGGLGAGRWSLDNAIGLGTNGYVDGWWGAIVAAVVGLGGAALQLAVFFRPPARKA
jgi:putative oxidoreductase